MRCVGLINKLLQSGATPAVPPTPTTPCHAERKTFLSRVGDCTGRAVRMLSNRLTWRHSKPAPPETAVRKLSCRALRSQRSTPLLPASRYV